MQPIKILDRAYICLHVSVSDNESLVRILNIMDNIGYDIIAIVNKTIREVSQIQDRVKRSLLLSKLCVSGRELKKYRSSALQRYDIISVRPEDRFILNKLIRTPSVDIVTVYAHERDAIPSKDQLKIMAIEGKALEILVDYSVLYEYRKLKSFDILLNQALEIEGLTVFVTNVVNKVSDIRCPGDLEHFLYILTEDRYVIRELRRKWLEFVVYTFYKRGVPDLSYFER